MIYTHACNRLFMPTVDKVLQGMMTYDCDKAAQSRRSSSRSTICLKYSLEVNKS